MNINDALNLTLAEEGAGRDCTYPVLNSARPVDDFSQYKVEATFTAMDDVASVHSVREYHMGGNCWWTVVLHGSRLHVLYWDGWFEVAGTGFDIDEQVEQLQTAMDADDWQPVAGGDFSD